MRARLIYLILSLIIIWLSFWLSLSKNGWEKEVVTMPVYTVKQGENWVSLADKLKVPLLSLLNRNRDIRALYPGVGLNVPRIPTATQTLGGQGGKGQGGKAPLNLGGQGPPKPPGGKGGGGGNQLPIPPRYTPPPGKPFRPYQPPGGGKGAPPPVSVAAPPQPRPVAPRAPLRLPPRPVFTPRREQTAFRAPALPNIPPPQQTQRGAAAYYAPQWGAGYGATNALRAFPGARATATVTPRTRRVRFGQFGQAAAGLGAGVGGAVQQFTRAFGAGIAGGARALNQIPPEGAFTPQGLARGAAAYGQGFAQGWAPAFRPTPAPQWGTGYGALPASATDAGEVQGADGNWYGFVRLHNAVTDEPGHMYPTVDPETGKTMEPSKMYYQALMRGEPPPQMSEPVRMALEPYGLSKDAMSVDWGYTWDEKTGFWVWGAQEEEGPQTLGYGGGYGGGYGYYGGGGGGGGGGGYQYSYPNYPTFEQQQQAYLPGRDRLPVGRFGLVSWRV